MRCEQACRERTGCWVLALMHSDAQCVRGRCLRNRCGPGCGVVRKNTDLRQARPWLARGRLLACLQTRPLITHAHAHTYCWTHSRGTGPGCRIQQGLVHVAQAAGKPSAGTGDTTKAVSRCSPSARQCSAALCAAAAYSCCRGPTAPTARRPSTSSICASACRASQRRGRYGRRNGCSRRKRLISSKPIITGGRACSSRIFTTESDTEAATAGPSTSSDPTGLTDL